MSIHIRKIQEYSRVKKIMNSGVEIWLKSFYLCFVCSLVVCQHWSDFDDHCIPAFLEITLIDLRGKVQMKVTPLTLFLPWGIFIILYIYFFQKTNWDEEFV